MRYDYHGIVVDKCAIMNTYGKLTVQIAFYEIEGIIGFLPDHLFISLKQSEGLWAVQEKIAIRNL